MPDLDEAVRSQIRNIEANTGRSMAEWAALVRSSGRAKHGEIMAWLKSDHGLTHGNANLIALTALRGPAAPQGDAQVDAIYTGPKATLRPLHDRVVDVARGFGDDVEPATGMCTHRVRLTEAAELDKEVVGWLRDAYERA